MKSWVWFVSTVLLAACSVFQPSGRPDAGSVAPASKYRFDYTVTNSELISLVRVFDDGGTTYFQFRDVPPEGLVVSAETATGEAIVPHERIGNYATIRGVYRGSSVSTATQPVVVRKLGEIAPMANIGPVVLPAPVDTSKRDAPTKDLLPATSGGTAGATPRVLKIRFAPNSTKLSASGRREIAAIAGEPREIGAIEVRVRPFYPTRSASVRLANRRAKAIRLALTNAGVAGDRVVIEPGRAAHPLVAEVSVDPRIANQMREQASAEAKSTNTDVNCRDATEPRPITATF